MFEELKAIDSLGSFKKSDEGGRQKPQKQEKSIIEPGSAEDLEREIDLIFEGISREEIERTTDEVRKKIKEEFKEAGKSDEGPDFEAAVFTRVALEAEKKKKEKMNDHEKEDNLKDSSDRKKYLMNLIAKNPELAELNLYAFYLPAVMKWTEKREAAGRDISFLEFIKEEEISKLELDIIIDECQKYKGDKKENISEKTARKKLEICDSIRKEAHLILSEIGNLEPNIADLKHAKVDRDFSKWMVEINDRVEAIYCLSLAGLTPLLKGYVKLWDGHGKIDRQISDFNKKKIGELEHVYMLKTISQAIEKVADLINKSSNAKEIQFYNNEIKKYYSILVEWNNEYKRLYKIEIDVVPNLKIQSAYKKISSKTKELDRILLDEKYGEDKKEENKKDGKENEFLTDKQDQKKRKVCTVILDKLNFRLGPVKKRLEYNRRLTSESSRFSMAEAVRRYNKYKKPIDENIIAIGKGITDILLSINEEKNINEIKRLIDQGKRSTYENNIHVNYDMKDIFDGVEFDNILNEILSE